VRSRCNGVLAKKRPWLEQTGRGRGAWVRTDGGGGREESEVASIEKAKAALLADVHGAWNENGNYKMELYQANDTAEIFYLFERWESQALLEEHFQQPYTKGAFDLQKDDLTGPIEMNYLVDILPVADSLKKQEHTALTTLIVPFETQEGKGEQLVRLFESFVPLVRQEAGNVAFHFHKVQGSETRFVLYERWLSQHHLDMHNQLPATIELVQQVQSLLKGTLQEAILFAKDISRL